MGKAKEKELSDIMNFPVITRSDVPDEKRLQVAREVNEELYDGLLNVKGANYLREKGITPPNQWNSDNLWKNGNELRSCYQKEYSAQRGVQLEEEKKRNRWYVIGLFGGISFLVVGYAIVDSYFQQKNEALVGAKKATADYNYCKNLFSNAQSEETKTFVKNNVTAPNSGRLCELVLSE